MASPPPSGPALTNIFSWFRALEAHRELAANEALPGKPPTLKMPCWAKERSELLGGPFGPLENLSSKCDEEISSISEDRSFLLPLICLQSAGGRSPGPDLHPDRTSTHVCSTGSIGSVPELN